MNFHILALKKQTISEFNLITIIVLFFCVCDVYVTFAFIFFIYETRRIVIADCLCVTKGLEERVGLEDDVLYTGHLCAAPTHSSHILHDELAGLGLPGARLSRDDHAVVGRLGKHVAVHVISNGVHYRREREKKKSVSKWADVLVFVFINISFLFFIYHEVAPRRDIFLCSGGGWALCRGL